MPRRCTSGTKAVLSATVLLMLSGGCATAPPIGAQAPEFIGVDQHGETVSLATYRNQVLILDFWSLWCGPCLRSGPIIQELHDRYEADADVSLLAVHILEQGDPAAYLAEHGYTYRTIEDGVDVAAAYDINALPTYLVIGPDGEVIYRHFGQLTTAVRDEIIDAVERHRP